MPPELVGRVAVAGLAEQQWEFRPVRIPSPADRELEVALTLLRLERSPPLRF